MQLRNGDEAEADISAALTDSDTKAHSDDNNSSEQERTSPVAKAFHSGIGLRMLLFVILFSFGTTLILTILQLYFDYRRDAHAIEERLNEIGHSNLDVIATSLWSIDDTQLRTILSGLLRLPDIQALEVTEEIEHASTLVILAGEKQKHPAISRDYPIIYTMNGLTQRIGTLHVEATLDNVYRRLIDTAIVIMTNQAIRIFLVALFILFLFYRLVARHLTAISESLGQYKGPDSPFALSLPRRPPKYPDELDSMVDAFNGMGTRLRQAYGELKEANRRMVADIAARHLAEQEVIRLNAVLENRVRQRTIELEAANEELAAFAYSVSHDLRAPLRRIEGFGQILAKEYVNTLDEHGRHYVTRMCAGAEDMAEMIDSFLKLSRSTSGALFVEHLDLSAMAAEIIARLQEKSPDRQVTVTVEAGLTVDGDRRLFGGVLQNLLENAWKYTRKTENPIISFGAVRKGEQSCFFVRDNGTGFDMAYAKRLFAPFVRLHRPEDFEGTGIGLTTVQRVIVRHGGRVWAEAEAGAGATFYFTCWDDGGTGAEK